MTKLLQQAINKMQQLTAEEQDKIATRILTELIDSNFDDDQWDKQMKHDWENGKLNQLIEKAEADIKNYQIKEIDEILCNA
ncbi:MAG: hypothetical protein IGQ45_11335 [Cyanobacterium sp. T60_A2020_053]|nr:hypothetical protein [Cyanobacterium sp. T60_A2020_053]